MPINKKLRQAIKKYRLDLGISKAEAARRAGITVAAYSLLERGVTEDMRLSTIEAISDGLGCKLDITMEPKRPKSDRAA